MPPRWYPPISCMDVIVSYDLLSVNRVPAQLTVYANRISFMFRVEGQDLSKFDQSDFSFQIFPDLDTLLVIGTGNDRQWNVYVFFSSQRLRDKCVTTMRLLFKRPIPERRLQYSSSLPSVSTIMEAT